MEVVTLLLTVKHYNYTNYHGSLSLSLDTSVAFNVIESHTKEALHQISRQALKPLGGIL